MADRRRGLFDVMRDELPNDDDRGRDSANNDVSDDDNYGSDFSEDEMSDESEEFVPNSDDEEESSGSSSDEGGDDDEAGNVIDEELDGTGNVRRTTTYKAKDGTEWKSVPFSGGQTPVANVCKLPKNRIPGTEKCETPSDCYELFVCEEILRKVVTHTNAEGRKKKGEKWIDTDFMEIKSLIGILLFIGSQKQSKVRMETVWEPLIGEDFVRIGASLSLNVYASTTRTHAEPGCGMIPWHPSVNCSRSIKVILKGITTQAPF